MRSGNDHQKASPPRLPHTCVKRGQCHGRFHLPPHPPFITPLPCEFPPQISSDHALALAPPSVRIQSAADYYAAQQALVRVISTSVFKKDTCARNQWRQFYGWMHVAPDLHGITDQVPFLHIFYERVCTKLLSAGSKPIRKRSVDKYLRSISSLPPWGPTTPSTIGWASLTQQLSSYQKVYPPPTRVRPLPVHVVNTLDTTFHPGTPRQQVICDLTWVAFFFLLCPGEYCKGTPSNSEISSSSWESAHTMTPPPPKKSLPVPTLSAWFLQTKKMASRVLLSGTDAQATPSGFQWYQCITMWFTFDATAPPVIPPLEASSMPGHGHKFEVPRSPHPSARLLLRLYQISGSRPLTSARPTSAKEGPWLSSWQKWIRTQSTSWGGGGEIQCSSTST